MSAEVKPDSLCPKGYKQTEVGVIPEEWDVKSFAELFEFRNGVNADKASYGQGVLFVNVLEPITYSHIYGSEITGQVTLPEPVVTSYAVRRGDVLFNRTSETQEEVGLAAIYLGTYRVVFGGFVIRGRPTDQSLDPIYSGYALRAPIIRSQIIPMGQGAIRANIGQQNLRLVVTPIPPLPEQRAIAEALSDVDALLGALDRLIAKKRDLKQAAMQQLLTGQIRLPGFHGEWEVKRLGDVAPLQRGFDLPNPQLKRGPFPVVYSNGILNFHAAFQVKGPGVVTGRSGTIGKVTFVEDDYWPHNTSLWVTSFKANDPKFVFYLYTWLGFDRFATGSGVPTLNRNDVHSFEVFIPPTIEEQTAIAAVLSDMDAELAALEQRRDKTRALKQGMMQELLTGRIRLV
jgi:type I restriction enzyme S subunit